jgi:Flp pilus assembly pilin Flp
MLSEAKHLAARWKRASLRGLILRCAQNDNQGRRAAGSGRTHWLARLHRDERGYTMLEYLAVFAVIGVPIILLFWRLFEIIADYFSMVAFYVTWPFL